MFLKISNLKSLRIIAEWIDALSQRSGNFQSLQDLESFTQNVRKTFQVLKTLKELALYPFLRSSILHKTFLVNTLCIFFVFSLIAQNQRGELEAKRQQLLKQIENTSSQLNKTKETRAAARDRLEALQNQIENREALINNLHDEIDETDIIVERTEGVLEALDNDIKRLRNEYGLTMRKAYKMKVPNNSWLFLMSSNSFSDAYRRWQYFKQYDKFRKRQATLIEATQKSLAAKKDLLTLKKSQKIILATTHEQQKNMLSTEQKDKDKVLDELKDEERRLAGELKTQEKQNTKLNSAIEKMIYAEIEAKRRAAEERSRKAQEEAERLARMHAKEKKREDHDMANENRKPERVITESSENLTLSSNFRENKGKLPPPATGSIVRSFGKQQVLDKVTAINNGIDIRTEDNTNVQAVFTGQVAIVSSVPGLGNVILIQHGNYYTVYSNLSSVYVKKGDTVTTRQTLGKAGVNPVTNESEVHFEVWLEKTHLNPSSWISK
jgi:murein hydrolase activator